MIALNPNVPMRRLIWSLSCTVKAPSMIPAMNTVVVITLRSDMGRPLVAGAGPPFPAVDSSQLSPLARLLIANTISRGRPLSSPVVMLWRFKLGSDAVRSAAARRHRCSIRPAARHHDGVVARTASGTAFLEAGT
jgi:hypothetical protein